MTRSRLQTTRHHYAVMWVLPLDHRAYWCRALTKRAAVTKAKAVQGQVYAVSYDAHRAWDAPTFAAVGHLIADYRPAPEGAAAPDLETI